jgi:hypothetical protein
MVQPYNKKQQLNHWNDSSVRQPFILYILEPFTSICSSYRFVVNVLSVFFQVEDTFFQVLQLASAVPCCSHTPGFPIEGRGSDQPMHARLGQQATDVTASQLTELLTELSTWAL